MASKSIEMTTEKVIRIKKSLSPKRFVLSLLWTGMWFGWTLMLVFHNFTTSGPFWGLISVALLVLWGYLTYRDYRTSVELLNIAHFEEIMHALVDLTEEQLKKEEEKSDDDPTV